MGYERSWDPRLQGRRQLLRLLPRRAGDDAAPQRSGPTSDTETPPDDHGGEGRDPRRWSTTNGARLTINGAYAKLPEGEFTVAQAWSGDIVGAKYYLPKGTPESVLGYWYPEDKTGLIGNDTIAIPADAPAPRARARVLELLPGREVGFENFADWNGYQPPFNSIEPDAPDRRGQWCRRRCSRAVVTRGELHQRLPAERADPEVDALWLDAWNEILAGG